jgi:small-conductance mechanosensitive channel/CRP-like cAMP-binding protein
VNFAAFRLEVGCAALAGLALGLLLLAVLPADRRKVRRALVVLALCALAEVAASALAGMQAATAANIVAGLAVIGIGVVLVRLAFLLLFRVVLKALGLQSARIVEDVGFALAIVGWGLVWLRLAGVDLSSLVATSAVITGVIAFSMQETLGNILGGLVLQFDHSIRVGDWVRFEDVSGRVVEIRWRYTAVETRNRETVFLPNGALTKQKFAVLGSRGDPARLWRRVVGISVAAGAPPARVCETLQRAIREADIACVAREPAATCVLLDFVDRGGHYAIRYWLTDPAVDDPTDSLVREHALAALTRAGMQLAAPYAERLVTKENETLRTSRHADEIRRRLDALARVELFAGLTPEELRIVADHLDYAPFLRGDTITRQGAVAHWLYLIVSGEADVWVEVPGSDRVHLSTLAAGSVFGEMGMMTGEPRRATVTAASEVECYRLDKVGFESVLRSRPDIANQVSGVLVERGAGLESLREKIRVDARAPAAHGDILRRVRDFFGLGTAGR